MVHREIPTFPDGHFANASSINMMNVSQYVVAYHVLYLALQNVLKLISVIIKFMAPTKDCFLYKSFKYVLKAYFISKILFK